MKFITMNNITCTIHPNDITAAARHAFRTRFVSTVNALNKSDKIVTNNNKQ